MKKRTKTLLIIMGIVLLVVILFSLAVYFLKIDVIGFLKNPTTILVVFVSLTMFICLFLAQMLKPGD